LDRAIQQKNNKLTFLDALAVVACSMINDEWHKE